MRRILSLLAAFIFCSCSQPLAPPEGHPVVFENKRVRVMEIINPPGGKIPLHNHDLPGVIIVQKTAKNVIRNSRGEIVRKDTPQRGVFWAKANGPHYSIENIDSRTMHLYRIELK